MFFAINLSQDCRARIFQIIEDLKNYSEPIKWEAFEKLHITTLFLGDVYDSVLDHLIGEAEKKLPIIGCSTVAFNEIGVFPNMKGPRVIWMGIQKNEIVELIAETLIMIALELGIKVDDKKFHPHVTLGRVKGKLSSPFITELKNIKFDSFSENIESVELMKSQLDRFGSKYYIHKKFNLREN
jgi:2'-5' RNA ligase